MLPDWHLLSPWRIFQAVIVYLWWMNTIERQGGTLAPFGCHFFYFRREHSRFRHGAGYFDCVPTILRRHLADVFLRGNE